MHYELRINGGTHRVDAEPETPVLWILRDDLGLTGTKYGCGVAQCGACTIHLEGRATRACVLPVSQVGAREITTIEGVAGSRADAVMDAWKDLEVPQCGFCQPGQIMTTVALLQQERRPDDEAIDAALAGNVCRCATYRRIRQAVHKAARKGGGRRG